MFIAQRVQQGEYSEQHGALRKARGGARKMPVPKTIRPSEPVEPSRQPAYAARCHRTVSPISQTGPQSARGCLGGQRTIAEGTSRPAKRSGRRSAAPSTLGSEKNSTAVCFGRTNILSNVRVCK